MEEKKKKTPIWLIVVIAILIILIIGSFGNSENTNKDTSNNKENTEEKQNDNYMTSLEWTNSGKANSDEQIEWLKVAIENYLSKWDENNSMNKSDWKLGSKGLIKGYNGENIEYISYNEFNDLYSNLTYNLNDVNEKVLDKIIEYLEKEQKYVEFNDLDRDCYSVSDFE